MKCLLLVLFSLVTLVVSQEAEDEKAAPQQQQQLLQPEPTRPQTQVVFDDTILFNISFANLEKNQTQNIDNQKPYEKVVIVNSNQDRYECIVPVILSQEDNKAAKENQVFANPYKLLTPLFAHGICSFRIDSYWTYEICHGKYIRQYHEDSAGGGSQQEFFLGHFDLKDYPDYEKHYEENIRGQTLPTVNVDDLMLPYIELNMTDGTPCDLSDTKRFTRVRYVCVETGKHELYSVKETATCEYEVIALSPLLCESPEFKLKNTEENAIACHPLDKAPTTPVGYQLKDVKKRSIRDPMKELWGDASLFKAGSNKVFIDSDDGQMIEFSPFGDNHHEHDEDGIETYSTPLMVEQFLKGEYCLQGGSGWWKYEFCYKKSVLQFHEEKKAGKVTIKLGEWSLSKHIQWLKDHPEKRVKADKTPKQVSHFYSNGDVCEETKKPRTVEVKLRCPNTKTNAEYVALYLLEPKTCEYVLGIESPIICDLLSSTDELGLFHQVGRPLDS